MVKQKQSNFEKVSLNACDSLYWWNPSIVTVEIDVVRRSSDRKTTRTKESIPSETKHSRTH